MAENKIKSVKPKVVAPAPKVVAASVVKKETGLTLPVFAIDGVKKGTISLSKEIFGAKINSPLMAQAIRVYLVNQRQGTQSTKTRGEVTGSTRKIYRQKGTGRARHGAITAPIFVGGGIAFGPRPRNFELKLSKQMKKKALFSALSSKLSQGEIFVVDLSGLKGKTSEVANLFKKLDILKKKQSKILFLTAEEVEKKVTRNIAGVMANPAGSVNTYEVLNSNFIVLSKGAASKMEEIFLTK